MIRGNGGDYKNLLDAATSSLLMFRLLHGAAGVIVTGGGTISSWIAATSRRLLLLLLFLLLILFASLAVIDFFVLWGVALLSIICFFPFRHIAGVVSCLGGILRLLL